MLAGETSKPRRSWSAERSALLADALQRTGRVRLRVHGESMLPALWPGEVVEIVSCGLEDVQSGEIVLARRDGRLFLHRLIAPATPEGFRLRGDSVPASDPLFPADALLGRLVRRSSSGRPGEGQAVSVSALPIHFAARWLGVRWCRAVGLLLCHCGWARSLALKLHRREQSSTRALRDSDTASEMGSL
jgi:Peptidase S24-like